MNTTPTELTAEQLTVIADNIEAMAKVGQVFKNSRLREKTVLVLLKDMTGLPQRDIKLVLDSLPLLSQEYLKPAMNQPVQRDPLKSSKRPFCQTELYT